MEESTRTCPSCGRALGPLATRCFYCGPAVADPGPMAPAPSVLTVAAPGPPPAAPDPNTHCPICKTAIVGVPGPTFTCPICRSRLECLFVSPVPLTVGMSSKPTLSELCINHPEVRAAARCRSCRKAVCDTCVFRGPTGSYCPECAVKPDESANRSTTRNGIISIVCGSLSLVSVGFLSLGLLPALVPDLESLKVLATFIFLGALVLSLVGIGLGFTSRDSVRKRSLAGLIGIIVNFLALGIYALRVVASMMGGDN